MEAIERFAADVAHEIRNPLTSIRSAVETLELVKDADGARPPAGASCKQDVGRLDRLITDISNASRLDAELSRESPRAARAGAAAGATSSASTRRRAQAAMRACGCRSRDGREPMRVPGREGPLSQVFRNLIDNARSFTPARRRGAGERWRASGAQAVVTVEDDGPGMPPENLETVFERFYTSRPKGAAFGGNSGLGLSIARQIVEAHGGTHPWAENRMDAAARWRARASWSRLPDDRRDDPPRRPDRPARCDGALARRPDRGPLRRRQERPGLARARARASAWWPTTGRWSGSPAAGSSAARPTPSPA